MFRIRKALPAVKVLAVSIGIFIAGVGIASATSGGNYYSQQSPLHRLTNSSTQHLWGPSKALLIIPRAAPSFKPITLSGKRI